MVIICTSYDGLESQKLQTEFRENQSIGSGEEDFWWVFAMCGHGGHLSDVTQIQNFRSTYLRRLHIQFGFDWLSGLGEDVWNCGRADAGLLVYYKLTYEPSAQVS